MNTLRNKMAVVMFAVIMVGQAAWAGSDMAVAINSADWMGAGHTMTVNNNFTGDATNSLASSYYIDASPTYSRNLGTVAFTGVNDANQGYFLVGGNTFSPNTANLTIGTVTFSGTNGVLAIGSQGNVTVNNRVVVTGDDNSIQHRGGGLTLESGVTVEEGGRIETYRGDPAINAEISVGTATKKGDVILQGGNAVISGYGYRGAGSLTFLDENGNSDFIVYGDGNRILGDVDFGGDGYDYMDMLVTYKSDADRRRNDDTGYYDGVTIIGGGRGTTQATVGDYFQDTGIVVGDDAYDTLVVTGDSFNVFGGGFAVSTDIATDMYFNGDKWNATSMAELVGSGQIITSTSPSGRDRIVIDNNAALNLRYGGLTTNGMNISIADAGDVVFGVGFTGYNVLYLNDSDISAANSGSVKFSEEFLKANHLPPASTDLVVGDAAGSVNLPDTYFDGLFGAFATGTNSNGAAYSLNYYHSNNIAFDGSDADFDRADRKLRDMYGKTTSGSMNEAIYRSVSNVNTGYFSRLLPASNATDAEFDSFYLNQGNLLGFAAGRDEYQGIRNLYNGNAMNSANQISQSIARTHIDASMRRSDQIRQAMNRVCVDACGERIVYNVARAGQPNTIWVSGFGLWESAGSRHGHAGYKYKSGGFILGYDRIVGDNLILGGSFAFNKGDFKDKAAIRHDSTIKNYSGNIYATYTVPSGFFGTVFAGYTYSKNDLGETYVSEGTNPLKARQRNHTKTWATGVRLGYDIRPNENFTLTPSVGFTYVNARSSAHDVHLGGALQGTHGRMKDHAAYIPVEVKASYDVKFANDSKLNLNGRVGYAYNFNKSGAHGYLALAGYDYPPTYRSATREQGRHTFRAGAGMTYSTRRWDFGVEYDYFRQAKSNNHLVQGVIGFNF